MVSPKAELDPKLVQFGTASFSTKDWVGPFYPKGTKPGDYLREYAKKFKTVEVDATYYAIPSAKVVDGWVDKTPEGFKFAAKFPRSIVHAGQSAMPDAKLLLTEETYAERDEFLEVISRLGDRLGTLLLQFPYFPRNAFENEAAFHERLDEFLDELPPDFRYAVEIRNRGWITPDTAHLCRAHDVAMVLVDQGSMPHADEVEDRFDVMTTDFSYMRLIGDRKEIEAITQQWDVEVIDRRERLRRWANFLVRTVKRGVPSVVYVNNHYAGHAPTTTRRLQEMFESSLARAE